MSRPGFCRALLAALLIVCGALVGCSRSGDTPAAEPQPVDTEEGEQRTKPLVFVDPGHGGAETGGVGVSGVQEKDLVLAVAGHLQRELEATGLVDVQLSRTGDGDVALVRRPRAANAAEAAVFVSLHMNWSSSPSVAGIESYYLDTATDEAAERLAHRENLNVEDMPTDLEAILADLQLEGAVGESRSLATRVHGELIDQLEDVYGEEQVEDRGIRTALFAVLVRAKMPAILIELCFLSNEEEERRARTRAYQEEVAGAIASGVIGFLRDQGELPPPDPLGEGTTARAMEGTVR